MNIQFETDLLNSYPRSDRFKDEYNCPRGVENGSLGRAVWENDETCSYCGSLHPDIFMERLYDKDVILVPTDKSYKVYVKSKNPNKQFQQTFRGNDCPGGNDPKLWKWTTKLSNQCKFYFQHLSHNQQLAFINLLNKGEIELDYPYYFYRTPFFIKYDR